MTAAKNTKADIEARAGRLAFAKSEDWKNIVRDLKLTKAQERELKITIRQVLADIDRYLIKRKELPRAVLVPALKRLEKALDRVQYEMARSKDLMTSLLPSKTLEFIGTSFTFTAIGQAIGKDVFPMDPDDAIRNIVESNNFTRMAKLENHFRQR
jgi:hypothetical protein